MALPLADARCPQPSGGFREEARTSQSPRAREQPSWSVAPTVRQRDEAPPSRQPSEPPECAAGWRALVPRSRRGGSSRARPASSARHRHATRMTSCRPVRRGWSRRYPASRPETHSRGCKRWQNPRRSQRGGRKCRLASSKGAFHAAQSV